MAGIQFFGVGEVVEAYEDYEVDCWAIMEGKDLIKTGCDSETLSKYLSRLQHHGSAATYILRVYRNADDPDGITAKMDYSACFKFKLNEGGSAVGAGITRYGGVDPLTAKLQGVISEEVGKVLDKKLGRDDDDKPNSFMDGIIGLLNQPDKLIETIRGLQGMFVPQNSYAAVGALPRRAGAVAFDANPTAAPHTPKPDGYAPKPVHPTMPAEAEETMERVAAALDRLEKADPDALVHLELLAALAEKQPAIYQMAVAQLKTMSK